MAEDSGKVKLEIDLPKDQVSIHAANEVGGPALEKEIEQKSETREELKKAQRQLAKVRKERDRLKEEQEDSDSESPIREALAKELDPKEEGPIKETTGYDLGEIITAPLHPPGPETKGRPKLTQVRNIIIGFALMPLALVGWLIFGGSVALAVAIVGAFFIAVGVFFRM